MSPIEKYDCSQNFPDTSIKSCWRLNSAFLLLLHGLELLPAPAAGVMLLKKIQNSL